jgi:hypothetical protein
MKSEAFTDIVSRRTLYAGYAGTGKKPTPATGAASTDYSDHCSLDAIVDITDYVSNRNQHSKRMILRFEG